MLADVRITTEADVAVRGPDVLDVVRVARSSAEVSAAVSVERSIFRDCGFADISDYEHYDGQSHIFGQYEGDGTCTGMVRTITSTPLPAPVLRHMTLDDRQHWLRLAASGTVAEFATAAILPEHRDGRLFLDLIRLAYRQARSDGIRYLMIIMEPERVEQLNDRYHFRYRRVGPDQRYRNEPQVTAPFALDLDEQDLYLGHHLPEHLAWFRDLPFRVSMSPQRCSTSSPTTTSSCEQGAPQPWPTGPGRRSDSRCSIC